MKRMLLTATMGLVLTSGGWVLAQTAGAPKPATTANAPKPAPPAAAHEHGTPGAEHGGAPGAEHKMGCGMMGGGMMGGGMMGGGMMAHGMCPMMVGGANTKIDVKKLDKGVTITLTSSDSATVVRLQKMAEAMRLMHEATTP